MRGLVVQHDVVDRILEAHRAALGRDFDGYRNHVYRVASFFDALGPERFDAVPSVAVAAAFHDLAIWVDGTWDYLEPSSQLARRFIEAEQPEGVDPGLVHELIVQHHKLRPYRAGPWASVVEQWRQADHIDVSLGLLRFGLPWASVRQVQRSLPDRGFHLRLLQLTLRELARRPWRPLPMIRW